MLEVYLAAQRTDQEDISETLVSLTNRFSCQSSFDPYQDVLITEAGRKVVANRQVDSRPMEACCEFLYGGEKTPSADTRHLESFIKIV